MEEISLAGDTPANSEYIHGVISIHLHMSTHADSGHGFQDTPVPVKFKLFALWSSVTLCYLYGDYFELYVPRKTEGLVNGENMLDSPMKLFLASVLLAIPAIMGFLSLIMKPALNRKVNIGLGVFYTLIMLLIAATSLTPWRAFYVFLAIVESALTAMVVRYAWKWPKV